MCPWKVGHVFVILLDDFIEQFCRLNLPLHEQQRSKVVSTPTVNANHKNENAIAMHQYDFLDLISLRSPFQVPNIITNEANNSTSVM